MYYLFMRNKKDLDTYKKEFDHAALNIQNGVTPVFCEMRMAKTQLIESVPFSMISGTLLILGSFSINMLKHNNTIAIALVLVVNSICNAIANYIFTIVKHKLRLKLCDRLGIDRTEENIAVMESLEYQSV